MHAAMARMARLVVPGIPHHVAQRGNGRAPTFFGDADDALYRDLPAKHRAAAGMEVWAWAPMPNHVHACEKRIGNFWQGRFGRAPMDEAHLAGAERPVPDARATRAQAGGSWRRRVKCSVTVIQ